MLGMLLNFFVAWTEFRIGLNHGLWSVEFGIIVAIYSCLNWIKHCKYVAIVVDCNLLFEMNWNVIMC